MTTTLLAMLLFLAPDRPNVVLVLTDDQGYGDLSIHGNPVLSTPNIDGVARSGARIENFYVCPVCSPTRAGLMTGRCNYRTRIVDTFRGRSMMDPAETTLPQVLQKAGYRTGIFGKWHLGDNYPMRPIDRGFQNALVHRGGGIGQPSDPPGGTSYFDPILQENGTQVRKKGYCSDVYTDAAIGFIEARRAEPFFVYLAFNAPHSPYEVPESYHNRFKDADLSPARFPKIGRPPEASVPKDDVARAYGMVANIDENVGRLLARLDALKLAENTIVVFLTDNGPPQRRFNAGMRGAKGTVYEGGVRVPSFWRWPKRIKPGTTVASPAANIDVMPTLLAACGVEPPTGVRLDGWNILPQLLGGPEKRERTLFFQWHRGDAPEMFRAFAARANRWKLVQANGTGERWDGEAKYELFDVATDPYELKDVAAMHPKIVEDLKWQYQQWFQNVSAERGFAPPRIVVGTKHENPTVLTRQDWRGETGAREQSNGHWEIEIGEAGRYRFRVGSPRGGEGLKAWVQIDMARPDPGVVANGVGETGALFLDRGKRSLYSGIGEGRDRLGALRVEVERIEK